MTGESAESVNRPAGWHWSTPIGVALQLLTAAALAVDAYVHLDLAPTRPPAGPSGGISQVSLFYAEGVAAALAALLVLLAASRATYALAFLVAASALGAVLLYRYVDIGSLGPLPNMYEPFWYADKVTTTIAEAVAVFTALAAAVLALFSGAVRSRRMGWRRVRGDRR